MILGVRQLMFRLEQKQCAQGVGDPYIREVGALAISDPNLNMSSKNKTCVPLAVQALGPHVAALGMKFYTGAAFPESFNRSILIALHGSWNRAEKNGLSPCKSLL